MVGHAPIGKCSRCYIIFSLTMSGTDKFYLSLLESISGLDARHQRRTGLFSPICFDPTGTLLSRSSFPSLSLHSRPKLHSRPFYKQHKRGDIEEHRGDSERSGADSQSSKDGRGGKTYLTVPSTIITITVRMYSSAP